MPLFHIGGSGWGLIGFYRGVESVLMRDADPAAILRLIPEFRITKVFVVPALILFMLQSPQCRATDFSSLELIVYGASPAPVDLVRNAVKVFGCGLAQVYGLTETTGAITYLPPEDHDERVPERLKSCGRAMTGVELRVVDALDNDVAVGEVGEIICRSPQIMLGYWNQPEATGKAVRSGWFHSGDAGYLDRDGYLYIYDRVKDMIISGGENIYPAEVENALFSHPAVADVAVIGVPDDNGPEFVSLSLLVLAPVAVSGLFGAIAADRHAAPSSRPPACTVGEHQRAAMSLTGFDVGEIFLARELRQGFADRQQQRFRRSPAPHHSQFQAIAVAMAMP
jgi:acyl-CoA synthetase (AMP-forming)/AMP-acid ligase II